MVTAVNTTHISIDIYLPEGAEVTSITINTAASPPQENKKPISESSCCILLRND